MNDWKGSIVSEKEEPAANPVKAVHDVIRNMPAEEREKAHERHHEVLDEVSSDESETVTD